MYLLLFSFHKIVQGSKELLLRLITNWHEQRVINMWILSFVSLTLLCRGLVHCLSRLLNLILVVDAVLPTADSARRLNLFLLAGRQKLYILVDVRLSFSRVCAVDRREYSS